jgi:hypothetical protein
VAQRHTGKAEAWYAVGCYYLVIGKLESARTYLSKATTLAPPAEAGPAWYPPSPCPSLHRHDVSSCFSRDG